MGRVVHPVLLSIGLCLAGLTQLNGQVDDQFEKAFRDGTQALRTGKLDEAAGAFVRCTELNRSFPEAWFNLGLVRFQQNRLDDAIPALEKSLQLKPKIRGANLFLGIARYRKDEFPAAATAFQNEAQIDPSNADAVMWLGIVRIATGNPSEAVTNLERASHLRPNDVDILYHLGRAHMLLSKEIYERMYAADPKSWRVHQVLAQSFADADRLDDAVKECLAAIQLKPAEPGLHHQLADIYWKQNNLEQAAGSFQDELKIDPDNTSAMYSLAVIDIERSQPDRAAALLTDVLRRAPKSLEAHYQLGRAQAQLGDSEGAVVHFAAVVGDPKRADAEMLRQSYYQMSQLYRRLHRLDESRAALDAFTKLKQQADLSQNQKLEDKLKKVTEETQKAPKDNERQKQ